MEQDEEGRIARILSSISYVPTNEISIDTDIFDDLDVDSLGIVELFVALEKEFQLKLNVNTFTRDDIRTPAKIRSIVNRS